ncbi:MAG: hydroxymethylbilane synthase [Acidobacteriota bacterium]
MRALRVGSRGSRLALVQTRMIMAELTRLVPGLRLDLVIIRTRGDQVTGVPLAQIGDRGLFTKDIENALLEDRIHFAVHSMKDVPSRLPSGLCVAASTKRLDPRDALVSRGPRSLAELPPKGTVATGSLRRRSQVLAHRPDLNVEDLRGNLPTRLRKFEASSWSAVILAAAGLERLGFSNCVTSLISTEQMLPAVGQGALCIEAREDDEELREWLGRVDHFPTAAAVRAERAFLGRLEGGCQVPIGALGTLRGDRLRLEGYLGTVDGSRHLRRWAEGEVSEPERIGRGLAEKMLEEGGEAILEAVRLREGAPR